MQWQCLIGGMAPVRFETMCRHQTDAASSNSELKLGVLKDQLQLRVAQVCRIDMGCNTPGVLGWEAWLGHALITISMSIIKLSTLSPCNVVRGVICSMQVEASGESQSSRKLLAGALAAMQKGVKACPQVQQGARPLCF